MRVQVKAAIEAQCWFALVPDAARQRVVIAGTGAPVTFQFAQPLRPAQLRELIAEEFETEDGVGPLHLWGNPIWLNDRQAHIYGLEIDTWQRVDSAWSTGQVVVLLHHGAPAEVVERILTRLQQLDPAVQLFIGDQPYAALLASLPPAEAGSAPGAPPCR